MESSKELYNSFQELKLKRKNGEISEIEYYSELLKLLKRVVESLKEENISSAEVKKQIPLIVLFISEQIEKFASRGN